MASRRLIGAGMRTVAKTVFALADVPYRIRPGPRILIYHQVGVGLGRQMEVTENAFSFQLDWLVKNGQIVTLEEAIARRGEPDSSKLFVLTFDDGYSDVYTKAFPLVAVLGAPFVLYLATKAIQRRSGDDPMGRDRPLSWGQITEMRDHGATIGAHTHSHPDLRNLSTDQVEEELALSDSLIERHLDVKPQHFCYPYGYWSHQADGLVRNRYQTATLGGGDPLLPETDPYLINRVPVQLGDSPFFFVQKMRTGMVTEERVRRVLSGYRGP